MEFGILGPLEVSVAGQPLAIGRARTRAVLALLLVEANRVVPADTLAQLLWPHLTTDRAVANLQVRLSELRRALRSVGEGDRLQSRPPGYRLQRRRWRARRPALRRAGRGRPQSADQRGRPWRAGIAGDGPGPVARRPPGRHRRRNTGQRRADPAGGAPPRRPAGKDRRAAGGRASPGDPRRARSTDWRSPAARAVLVPAAAGPVPVRTPSRSAAGLPAAARHPGRSDWDRAQPTAARAGGPDPAAGPGTPLRPGRTSRG